ncbi:hypothetical protein LIPSTDRAFT_292019 [Lipomyces starkeyi NRRL Y-11557]|uniref:Uncharacterized protein n=1 Tax=Lipomyces starkeyi NRRL Y-11557 TaxID=675824 RepID=A0A1E3Q8S5_LIPST|nr:hypothetical protein LIPSTDRAFT_292019 [Lipomyces starkeyi NRRL Y-11557]
MADSDCEILSDSGVDDLSVGSFKRPQRARRLDYRLLNDGSDDEAAPEDRMVKRGRFPSPLDSSQPITPDDSASQLSQDVDHIGNYPQNEAGSLDEQSETSLDSMESSKPSAQRQNTLLCENGTGGYLIGRHLESGQLCPPRRSPNTNNIRHYSLTTLPFQIATALSLLKRKFFANGNKEGLNVQRLGDIGENRRYRRQV